MYFHQHFKACTRTVSRLQPLENGHASPVPLFPCTDSDHTHNYTGDENPRSEGLRPTGPTHTVFTLRPVASGDPRDTPSVSQVPLSTNRGY